jgi:predicted amidophosphoribosyltransferase
MSETLPPPAGIGECRSCAYLGPAGTPTICFDCARATVQPLAEDACGVCDQAVGEGGRCGNILCSWPVARRYFDWNFAIAMRSGVLLSAINRYKYLQARGWESVFARLLVGLLEKHSPDFDWFDAIIPSPTVVEPPRYDHTRGVIVQAMQERGGDDWPFDISVPGLIVKTRATPSMVEAGGWSARRAVAEGPLREALEIPDPNRVREKAILVYDDVFTDGFTLREVARCLRRAGARNVCGVTLARQPWREQERDG